MDRFPETEAAISGGADTGTAGGALAASATLAGNWRRASSCAGKATPRCFWSTWSTADAKTWESSHCDSGVAVRQWRSGQ